MSPPAWWMAKYVSTAPSRHAAPTFAKIDCPHLDRETFARGGCQPCYFKVYRVERAERGNPL